MYKVQVFDADCETWEDADECQPTKYKEDAEDDMREMKRKCAYGIRCRVVKE